MRRYSFIAAVFTLALCGCNRVDNLESNEKTVTPTVYHLSIQASMDSQTKGVTFDPDGLSISTQFKTTDNVYIYNETKKAMARYLDENWDGVYNEEKYLPTAIHPSNISASGSGCTLEGELSFWKWDGSDWNSVAVGNNDTYSLFYQMNYPQYYDYYDPYEIPLYVYIWQDGSAESASKFDFAQASGFTMTKSESGTSLIVPDGVQFTNLQSMFRQHLTFVKDGVTVSPTSITSLDVNTAKTTFVANYRPTEDPEWRYGITKGFRINNPDITDGDVFLSLAFDYTKQSADGDQFILTACDDEHNVYQGSKGVPGGGFQKSKYYHGDMPMLWKYKEVKPNVTRTDGGDEVVPKQWKYIFDDPYPDPVEFTISGSSAGYCFYISDDTDAIITLCGNGTAVYSGIDPFIWGEAGDITITLGSNYFIDCRDNSRAIFAEYRALKLKTEGPSPQTLTVTAKINTYKGLYGNSNYNSGDDDVSPLAADGYQVELTSTTNGPDEDSDGNPDYYTWVYTVSPTTP